ncbi:MAG: metal-dependent hydrolase [Magnetococcales bacterium]|nr:metal-dependent hydrolase [Magnetococcales bacterium]MBF0321635.1 metal-dependent hydrolase [Magnetococcales bacterium]
MANFRTHFNVAAVAGGVCATSLLVAGEMGWGETLACFSAAIIGGLLPDLDADNSTPLSVAFSILAVCCSFLLMFSQVGRFSVLELLFLWGAGHFLVRQGVFRLFNRLTVHRGIFHSVPAIFLFAYLTVLVVWGLCGASPKTAWLTGTFVGIGVFIHLFLDEIFGINPLNPMGMKHAMGSALKLHSREWLATGLMYVAVAALYLATPHTDGLYQHLLRQDTWQRIEQRFMPKSGWFVGGFSGPVSKSTGL